MTEHKIRVKLNEAELHALSELPLLQRCIYIFALKPFVDYATNIVGIKRVISWQSIADQLYIRPQRGIKIEQFHKQQLRRAVEQLEKKGLIIKQKGEETLVFELCLAARPYSVQNKADRCPTPLADTQKPTPHLNKHPKADRGKMTKADTPLIISNNNIINNIIIYIYIYAHLEKICSDALNAWFRRFWQAYPVKKSKHVCRKYFLTHITHPDLFATLLRALNAQKQERQRLLAQQAKGTQLFIPPWKYPLTWLQNKCWEDDVKASDHGFSSHAQAPKAQHAFPINADFSHIDYGDSDA